MRNKWFVVGMAAPAVGLTVLAIWCLATQSWLVAIIPALLAAGLFRGSWWAWRSESFAAVPRRYAGDVGTSAAVTRWQQHTEEREAAARAKPAAMINPSSPSAK